MTLQTLSIILVYNNIYLIDREYIESKYGSKEVGVWRQQRIIEVKKNVLDGK